MSKRRSPINELSRQVANLFENLVENVIVVVANKKRKDKKH